MKKIHFILPGGGVKGSFQGGFLYELNQSGKDLFTIGRVDGTSVGALNGFAFTLGRLQDIYDIWFRISSIHDIFENWTELPYISSITCGYRLINNYGLYGTNNLRNLICDVEDKFKKDQDQVQDNDDENDQKQKQDDQSPDDEKEKTKTDVDNQHIDKTDDNLDIDTNVANDSVNNKEKQLLERFNCVVTCIRGGTHSYINGTHKLIKDFIVASASPWIVTCPREIDGELYTDGGLLHTFPIDYIGKADCDLTVVLGYDEIYHETLGPEGTNTLTYLSRIIDIVRMDSSNIKTITDLKLKGNTDNIVFIENNMKIGFLDFNPDNIKKGFNVGREMAKKFIQEYLV